MASLNPFHEDFIEDQVYRANEFDEITLGSSEQEEGVIEQSTVTLDHIAERLLNDNLILTALELHTELVEARKELPRLRDYFSNPGNFERTKLSPEQASGLHRTSSCQTFDSLDFTRYSDDGERQEGDKVAVLEFELRKAHDTIKSLRASLTKTADTVPNPDSDGDKIEETSSEEIKPHEKRAVNFLVNEYLLNNNYKITSVTFAEENENQDFDDWDDVGLNIPKPPDLLRLYRDFGQHFFPSENSPCEAATMVNMDEELGATSQIKVLNNINTELTNKIQVLEEQIQKLSNENAFLGNQLKNFERISDASAIKSSTPVVSPITTPSQTPAKAPRPSQQIDTNPPPPETQPDVQPTVPSTAISGDTDSLDSRSLGDGAEIDEISVPCVTSSAEDRADSTSQTSHVESEPSAGLEASVKSQQGGAGEGAGEDWVDGHERGPVNHVSTHRDEYHTTEQPASPRAVEHREMSRPFQDALFKLAFHVSPDNRIANEVRQVSGADPAAVVPMLGRCLPHIVPNVLLNKREELIPVIVTTATLHPDSRQRDQLLNILFNLIKKPDLEQRHMILTGCVAFARYVGPERVESELLPQCWEQIAHKYWERRLLVAEACGALAPHLPPEIRGSLVLSMLLQMLEDEKEDLVRKAIVASLGILYGFVSDQDKYIQGGRLLMKTLVDTSEDVARTSREVFLPTFAMWTLEMEKVEADLFPSFMRKLIELVRACRERDAPSSLDQARFKLYMRCMEEILPFLFVMILKSAPFTQQSESSKADSIALYRFPKPASPLTDISVIVGDNRRLSQLVAAYETYIGEEWYEPWDSFAWVAGEFMPEFINFMNSLEPSLPAVVHSLSTFLHSLCRTFGRTFTITKVKQKFQKVLIIPENHKVSGDQGALCRCTAVVYASGVLAAFTEEEDLKALELFLQDLMTCVSVSELPLLSVRAAFQQLSADAGRHEMLLRVLWAGIVASESRVRATAASVFQTLACCVDGELLSQRVVPALITLASDPEMSVRVATVPALGTIIETCQDRTVLAKVHMQLDMFADDVTYQHEHAMHVQMLHMLTRVGPNAEPWFREDFVLPRLAVYAAGNLHESNDTHRREVALSLFEAYTALSCCYMSEALISERLIPGLHSLSRDLQHVAPGHVTVLDSMIREFQEKIDHNARLPASSDKAPAPSTAPDKTKMFSRFKDVTARFSHKK